MEGRFSKDQIKDMVIKNLDGMALELIAKEYNTTRERVRIEIKNYLEKYNPMRTEMKRFIRSWDENKTKFTDDYVWEVNTVVRTIEKLVIELDDNAINS